METLKPLQLAAPLICSFCTHLKSRMDDWCVTFFQWFNGLRLLFLQFLL